MNIYEEFSNIELLWIERLNYLYFNVNIINYYYAEEGHINYEIEITSLFHKHTIIKRYKEF